jgi:drug/metabolite transporter (DMT)-like permease
VRAAVSPATVVIGAASASAYLLVLLALRLASAPAVAAVRESSVVIATTLAAVVLHERVGPTRLAGACVVVAGVALLALS